MGTRARDTRRITFHAPAVPTPWGHVVRLADGAAFVTKWKKPVVSDEPIGAGPVSIPGRRDNDPDRFRAAALLTRMAGLGATFHYEQGLQARIPTGIELRCFDAWNDAWSLLPNDIEARWRLSRGRGDGSCRRRVRPWRSIGSVRASARRYRVRARAERPETADAHLEQGLAIEPLETARCGVVVDGDSRRRLTF